MQPGWQFYHPATLNIVVIKPGPWLSLEELKSCCLLELQMYEWRIVDGVLVGTGDYLFGGGSERLSINETGEVNDFSVGMSRLLRFSEAASIARCDCELKMIES